MEEAVGKPEVSPGHGAALVDEGLRIVPDSRVQPRGEQSHPRAGMLAHAAWGTLESFRVYLRATLHSKGPEEQGQGSNHLGRKGDLKMRDRTLEAARSLRDPCSLPVPSRPSPGEWYWLYVVSIELHASGMGGLI